MSQSHLKASNEAHVAPFLLGWESLSWKIKQQTRHVCSVVLASNTSLPSPPCAPLQPKQNRGNCVSNFFIFLFLNWDCIIGELYEAFYQERSWVSWKYRNHEVFVRNWNVNGQSKHSPESKNKVYTFSTSSQCTLNKLGEVCFKLLPDHHLMAVQVWRKWSGVGGEREGKKWNGGVWGCFQNGLDSAKWGWGEGWHCQLSVQSSVYRLWMRECFYFLFLWLG